MENAATAVCDVTLARFPGVRVVHVLCGPGNNGGDGFAAARLLKEVGCDVRVWSLGEPRPESDAALAKAACSARFRPVADFTPEDGDVVIDALFGAGLTRRLPDVAIKALEKAVAARCRIIAVDLPSGVNGDSGINLGGAVGADETVTFFRKKPGHLLLPGRNLCGAITIADIGIPSRFFDIEKPMLFENGPDLWQKTFPRAKEDQHKYSRGHVAVFSGPRYATGAARLSAMAAQRAGAGAVTILGDAAALDIHAAHVTSIMLRETSHDDGLDELLRLKRCGACVLGPGFGNEGRARRLALGVLGEPPVLVLDADGITAFSDAPSELFEAARKPGQSRLILTPHAGEFARLFPDLADNGQLSKLGKALKAAERSSAVVVYKGSDTVIASPDGCAAINVNGTPSLATAGSGDVLAGLVAGFVCQGMPLWEAACAAVWVHGEAGRAAGGHAVAEDLVDVLRPFTRISSWRAA